MRFVWTIPERVVITSPAITISEENDNARETERPRSNKQAAETPRKVAL